MKKYMPILVISILAPLFSYLYAQEIAPKDFTPHEGVIVKVISAGKLVIWEKGSLYPFTLYGIDLPAPSSPEGLKAKKKVSDLIFNTLLSVYLTETAPDTHSGIVIIRGKCLNETLVRSGVAKVAEDCNIPEYCSQWKAAE